MLLITINCAIERQAWLSEGSALVVGPFIILPTNVIARRQEQHFPDILVKMCR